MKVLLSAYACEPNRGSEPGVGWEWATALSQYCEVTVITRANNESVIKAWYRNNEALIGRSDKPQFIYYDPPALVLWMKKKKCIPVQLFYLIWQIGVAFQHRKTAESFDVVHHVTFNSMMLPGFWWFSNVPTVLGPLGGTSRVSDDYLPIFGNRKWKERLRATWIKLWCWFPWLRSSFNQAAVIFCANKETKDCIDVLYAQKTQAMLETGIRDDLLAESPVKRENAGDKGTRFIWIGAIEPWKALEIALRGYARMLDSQPELTDTHLDVVGAGSELDKAISLAEKLSLVEKVTFHGQVPKDEVDVMLKKSDALVFTSVKDTSGNVVLEAMARGVAVICINHQGVADITTDETAIRINPGKLDQTVNDFSNAMQSIVQNPQNAKLLGHAGYERVKTVYAWGKRAEEMFRTYKKILD